MSPRTSEQLTTIRKESRDKILKAAMKLFAENGFHACAVSQVAKEAGVAKGLIYNYFESKEALLMALVMQEFEQGEQILAEMMAQPTAKDKLRWIFEFMYTSLREKYEYHKLVAMLSLKLDNFPKQIKDMVRAKYTAYLPFVTHLFLEMGMKNPESEARLLAATLDGLALHYLTLHDAFPLRQAIDDLTEKYCT